MSGLLLDVGVVMLRSAWELADEYEALMGLPPGTVPGRGPFDPDGDAEWRRHLAGDITESDYWMAFAAEGERRGAPVAGYRHLMQAMFQTPGIDPVRPEAMAIVTDAAAAGRRVGILSNELYSFQGEEWVRATPIFADITVICDGGRMGVMKPADAAYQKAIAAMGEPAHDIVFIDDNPRYASAGAAHGLQAVWLDVLDVPAAFAEARRRLGLD